MLSGLLIVAAIIPAHGAELRDRARSPWHMRDVTSHILV